MQFSFRCEGDRPLHDVQFLIFSNPIEDPSSPFAICSLKVFSNIRPAVSSFLSRSCRTVLGSFTPVLHSGSTRRLFLNVHSFRVPLTNLILVCSFRRPCSTDGSSSVRSLCRATFAQRVVLIPVAANSFRCPHFSTAGQLPSGGSQLPPGSTIFPGNFPHFLGALRGHIPDLTPLPRSFDRHYCGVFLGDLLMLLLHHSWIGLSLRRFSADGHLIHLLQLRPEFTNCGSHFCLASISSCLAFVLSRMAFVSAFILAFIIFCRPSWWAFLSASLFACFQHICLPSFKVGV
jgi:hypothetical protein